MKTILLLLLLAVAAYSQELPEYRDIKALEGKTRIYVTADAKDREIIIKALKKETRLSVVDNTDDADFVLEYKLLSTDRVTSLQMLLEKGQLEAYFTDKKRVIAWSKGFSRTGKPASGEAVKKFLEDWRKAFIAK